jgi:hypothetical protein
MYESSSLYSCHHINAVVSYVSQEVIPANETPADSSPTYADEIAEVFSEYLIGRPDAVVTPGDFILSNVNHQHKSGKFSYYLSEYEGIYTFAKT